MPWGSVDDGFYSHPKVTNLIVRDDDLDGVRALGFWPIALSWACRHTIDKPPAEQGVLPSNMIKAWDRMFGGMVVAAEMLADAKLWDRLPDGAYRIHNFRKWANLEYREAKQRAGRASANRRWGTPLFEDDPVTDTADGSVSNNVSGSATNAASNTPSNRAGDGGDAVSNRGGEGVSNLLASPSLSSPSLKTQPLGQSELDLAFDDFYWKYPRHVGKDAARRAFYKAAARATVTEIVAGAVAFTATVERRQTPPSKVPHPATWLNAGRWADDDPDDGPVVRERGTFE